MNEYCRLCRQPAFIGGHPVDGAVRHESGWVAHMLCVLAWGRRQQAVRHPSPYCPCDICASRLPCSD